MSMGAEHGILGSLGLLVHAVEIATGFILLYITMRSMQRFKLAIWKKSWYTLGFASILLIIKAVSMLLYFHVFPDIAPLAQVAHYLLIADAVVYLCIAIGIYMLSTTATKIWGGTRK